MLSEGGGEHQVSVGDRIRRKRLDRGISIPEAASLVGMNRGYWYQVETGRRHPTVDHLGPFAQALGCSLSDLVEQEPPIRLSPLQQWWLRLLDTVPPSQYEEAAARVAGLGARAAVEARPSVAMSPSRRLPLRKSA
ncbi:MAG: helix-turn-helix domain-containing protein [Steroidobacteraceae bacterium]